MLTVTARVGVARVHGSAQRTAQGGRMLDLLIRGGRLPDGKVAADIGILNGRIVEIAPHINAAAARTIEAAGRLVAPSFVDPHFHMDATLSLGLPRLNRSGTLLEGIALWGELKPLLTVEAVMERALRYCDLAVSQGLLAIRTHVDVCDDRLTATEALIEVRRRVAPYIDLQLVAFPQDGLFRSPNAEANLLRALDMGVDVVGGIPHFERTMQDGTASVRRLCEIAAERGLPVDLHCDESDDPMSRHIETLAAETMRLGLQGRVVGSHCTSMHSMDNYYASKLIPLIAEAGLHIVPNPLINLTLQGRSDTYPRRRGLTRVAELRAAGVNVALGTGLHDGSVVSAWVRRHAGSRPYGRARRSHDLARGDGLVLYLGHRERGAGDGPARPDAAGWRAGDDGGPAGARPDRGRAHEGHPPGRDPQRQGYCPDRPPAGAAVPAGAAGQP